VASPFIAELQRRRVFRALIGYGIAAFAVLQIIEPVMHGLHWPEEVLSYVVVALAAGFPIVVALAWAFDVRAGRLEKTPPARGLRRRFVVPLLAGIGAFAAVPGLYYYLVVRAPKPASIAVLPLVNLSRDPDQDYFADGLAEELIDLLAKVPDLHVAARVSAFSFKGKNDDARTIAEKLNVATLLEGSVRRSGDEVRITTQLINAKDGYQLWSETYDRKLTDVFAVQDDIAQSVVAALKVRLAAGQTPSTRSHRTVNPEAYTDYLLGRQVFNGGSVDQYRRAVKAYEKALALDPGFAAAWAGLAQAEYWIADSGTDADDVARGQQLAREAAAKAVALAPDLPEAYSTRGAIRSATEWDWEGARSDFKQALALSPEDADVIGDYALYVLRPLGRLDEAIALASKAATLDPLNSRRWTSLGGLLICAGRVREGRAAIERAHDLSPEQSYANAWLGVAFLLEKQPARALEVFAQLPYPPFRLLGTVAADHDLGRAKESQVALNELIAYAQGSAYQIAAAYAYRGEKDRAFDWLETARKQHDGGLTLLQIDPMLRSIRNDPRYDALLKELNLHRP
jgi:TolB-like protein